jgi:glucose/arabinose dehydrogenase
MVLAVSPGILAKLFTSDRDVANVITQIRIKFATSDDGDWTVENAVAGRQFLQPIQVKFPPRVNDTMYVLERNGRLHRVPWRKPGQVELHLDVADRVGEAEIENGALGFALHPEFGSAGSPNAGFVYLYYTSVIDGEQINRLSRFDIAGGDAQHAAGTETVMIELDRSEDGFHNGGSVEFGPDGFLYVALGEMSEAKAHQRVDVTLSGGIIRIDVDQKGGKVSRPISRQPRNGKTAHYFIPLDNPFVDQPGVLEEFYALGLRNPFRIAFDPDNGALWAGDVGSTVWEEVNLIESGGNYQFPYVEGREPTGSTKPSDLVGREIGPLYTYRHTAYERAVIGGVVYRGERYPDLQGLYLFGDNYSGNIYTMGADGSQTDSVDFLAQANQYAQRGITSFTETPDGEILLTTLGSASGSSGEIIRLVPKDQASAGAGQAPVVVEEKAVSADEALSLFSANCSRCHGANGHADGPDSAHLGVAVPDFSTKAFQSSRSDDDIHAVIEEGGAARRMSAMMPPWGMALSDAEIRALVALIRTQAAE